MAEPQGGIISEPSEHARFLVLRVRAATFPVRFAISDLRSAICQLP
jgi:hypothetical protein